MRAIICKYLGPKNTHGARIKASMEGVKSVTIPYPYHARGQDVYYLAALELCKQNGLMTDIVGGQLPDNRYVFCFKNQINHYCMETE